MTDTKSLTHYITPDNKQAQDISFRATKHLAHELGVSKETVSLWVSNKKIIPDEYIEQLHKFFEYQLELDH